MDGKSLELNKLRLEHLKDIFPEAFVEGKLDFEKFKLTLGEDLNIDNERYILNWAGKSDAFKVLQTHSTATLAPDKEESVNFNTTENIFIEGENLEVLKVLQKSYYGKIKMIYIDPPYNTGNDSFIYPDKFSETKDEYLKRIGEKDEEGLLTKEGLFRKNSKENGQYHSNWLSMMYPRLFLARNLLCDDGVIFISIDDNEVHNLRMIMNEIFGEENFIAQFVWKSRQNKDNRNITGASLDHEYVICYGRKLRGDDRKYEQYSNPDDDPRGDWSSGNMVGILTEDKRPNCHYDIVNPKTKILYKKPKLGWRYDKNTMNRLIQEDRILWPSLPEGRPRRKVFLKELLSNYTGFSSLIGLDIYTRNGTVEVEELFGNRVFDFPKPTKLLKELLIQGLSSDDIVLDFFAGSGSLAQALYELNVEDGGNRKYILIQFPELLDSDSVAAKMGYLSISDICKTRIQKVLQKINKRNNNLFYNKEVDLGFRFFHLNYSNFKIWRTDFIDDEKDLYYQLDAFENHKKENTSEINILYELILKAGYELTTVVEQKAGFYSISDNELVIVLSKFDSKIQKEIIKLKPKKCIILDILFKGNDKLKTNTVLQMKDAGIEFKTI